MAKVSMESMKQSFKEIESLLDEDDVRILRFIKAAMLYLVDDRCSLKQEVKKDIVLAGMRLVSTIERKSVLVTLFGVLVSNESISRTSLMRLMEEGILHFLNDQSKLIREMDTLVDLIRDEMNAKEAPNA